MNKYSVPYDLIGEKVNLRLTPNKQAVSFLFCHDVSSLSFSKYCTRKLYHTSRVAQGAICTLLFRMSTGICP